jgi:hypothetical protein
LNVLLGHFPSTHKDAGGGDGSSPRNLFKFSKRVDWNPVQKLRAIEKTGGEERRFVLWSKDLEKSLFFVSRKS